MSYDPKCYELAEYFFDDAPIPQRATRGELAQIIQDAIEDYLHVPDSEPAGSRDRDEWKHEAAEQQRLK